jgi:hypothetical protein
MFKFIIKVFLKWLPIAAVSTILSFTIYTVVQQNYRISANDPQIQIAEDTANLLSNGTKPENFVGEQKIEISKSLAPYIMIFDDKGNQISGNALLDGSKPSIPLGIFDYVNNHGEDRLTWQPRVGVRSAIVVTKFNSNSQSGFVVVGRSLREVEARIDNLGIMVGLTWLGSLGTSLFLIIFAKLLKKVFLN